MHRSSRALRPRSCVHRFADDAEAQAADAGIEIGGVVVDGVRRGGRVERIVSGDDAEETRRIRGRSW